MNPSDFYNSENLGFIMPFSISLILSNANIFCHHPPHCFVCARTRLYVSFILIKSSNSSYFLRFLLRKCEWWLHRLNASSL